MDLVKYCPKCNFKNRGSRSNCKQCGEDLSNVPKVQDGDIPGMPKPPEKKKICPVCHAVNSAKSVACVCGAELGAVDAIPADKVEEELSRINSVNDAEEQPQTPKEAPKPQTKRKAVYACLVSDDGSYSYTMKPGGIIIVGRQNVMNEYLLPMEWVSRRHAEIGFVDGVLTVQDLGSQNHTYVNGKKVRNGEVRELSDGDILSLGDSKKDSADSKAAFFRIELR